MSYISTYVYKVILYCNECIDFHVTHQNFYATSNLQALFNNMKIIFQNFSRKFL